LEFKPIVLFEHSQSFARAAGYKLKDAIDCLDALNYQVFVVTRDSDLAQVRFPRLEVLVGETKNFIAIPKNPTTFS
jgi:hypothetical protein